MLEEKNSFSDLKITAYHEAGHAVVTRLLGIPIDLIVLKYRKRSGNWEGKHNGEFYPSPIPDNIWDDLRLDSKIPYDELQFEYPTYPEPYQDYTRVRDRCTIDYAGVVTQKLFYERRGQQENPMVSQGCSNDMNQAKKRVEGEFQDQDVRERELAYAQSHAEKILSNERVWKMLEDLAKYMINAILTGQKEAEEIDLIREYWFDRKTIYQCFARTLTRDNSYKIIPLKERYLKFGTWLAEPRPAANFDAPIKIVMRQTGDSIVAAIDIDQYLCLNNMHVLVPNGQHDPLYIIGILNSQLLNWYYHTLNPEMGEALAEVKKTNVAKLPIRIVNLTDTKDKARHDQMVELVERMLSLHKRLAEARIPNDKTVLQQQIVVTDKQIDRLVYELYSLTEEEINMVEGKLQDEQ